MTENQKLSPAEIAANEAQQQVFNCLKNNKSFILEAGAGAGKTHTLIMALQWLISEHGNTLEKQNQQIACITYTNVAKDEIDSRTDGHPVIFSGTVHAFCWSLINRFQSNLAEAVYKIPAWTKRIDEIGGLENKAITYELGYRNIYEDHITLHHDDVISLTADLFHHDKFRKLLNDRYPILLIDEYQDTDKQFVRSLEEHYIETQTGPILGFFGDPWQTIYASSGCGNIDHKILTRIGKKANFRSASTIVDYLNRIRHDLPQHAHDPESIGNVTIFHTNNWKGKRKTGAHWGGDLPEEEAHSAQTTVRKILIDLGWDFSPQKTKSLMLTHKVLAKEMGYENLLSAFGRNEDLIKKENPYIQFFVDSIEPASEAYIANHYGEMFTTLGQRAPKIGSISDKKSWAQVMDSILQIRDTGTIGELISTIERSKKIFLPSAIRKVEKELRSQESDPELEISKNAQKALKIRNISYKEVVSVAKFINDHTPFSTKHGVKGAEFENVLVVFGRGWSHYNFNRFLEWADAPQSVPKDKMGYYERNRNLFYVVCSRPQKRLSLLFTQELSPLALKTLSNWFGEDAIQAFEI